MSMARGATMFGRLARASSAASFITRRQTTAAYHSSARRMNEKIVDGPVSVTMSTDTGNIKIETTGSAIETVSSDPSMTPDAWNPTESHHLTKSMMASLPRTLRSFTLAGKVCVVTGGGRGLGNHIAQGLGESGATAIALFDINQALGDAAAEGIGRKGDSLAAFWEVDVRQEGSVARAIRGVEERFGHVDVLVNAAGIADSNIKAEDYDPAMFRRLIDINLTGSFIMAQAVGRSMMASGRGGSIILVASMSGSIVNYPQEQCAYNASKAGVIQLGRSLAAEWAQHNIRVNCISPGYMDTALNQTPGLEPQKKIWRHLTPQKRLGNPDELNGLALWLASDASTFTTGANIIIDVSFSSPPFLCFFCAMTI
ncbi:MAG: hypothetical protein M1823_002095 [Watsoniomyces obsoletus]|nr:MAG: hypothetical protein M1823_002095 [Watsoniomyces obsoletus]